MTRSPSPEFTLLVACCRWPPSPDAVAEKASTAIDWSRLVRLAKRHRVEGLVSRALVKATIAVPEAERAALYAAAAAITHQNLAIAAESVRLRRAMEMAGTAPLFVKGVTLGKLAYGDIVRKSGWDIDILIDPDDLEVAAALLSSKGYTLSVPASGTTPSALRTWHRYTKESVWHRASDDVWVELHTSLTDLPDLLPTIDAHTRRCEIEVSPGLTLPTLPMDELFAYLCVHGASSAWFRLKWIADLAALIADLPSAEIERLYERSLALQAGRSSAQALLLADRLFSLDLPTALRETLRSDRTNRLLAAIALRKLTGRGSEVELDDVTLGTASIHLSQALLLPGWRHKRAAFARMLASPVDRAAIPLSGGWSWLYPFIQLRRLMRERGRA